MLSINPKMAKLSPNQFKRWFKQRWPGLKWQDYYTSIGGIIPKPKPKPDDVDTV